MTAPGLSPDDPTMTTVRNYGPEGSYTSEHACLRLAQDKIAALPEGWRGVIVYSPEDDEDEDEPAVEREIRRCAA